MPHCRYFSERHCVMGMGVLVVGMGGILFGGCYRTLC